MFTFIYLQQVLYKFASNSYSVPVTHVLHYVFNKFEAALHFLNYL